MITCSSKGNYRKQPTCRSGRLEGTQEPSLPGYLTIHALTGNAGKGSCFANTGSEQTGQRQHHHTAQRRDVEELQKTPQASQQGHDAPAETQLRHFPIQKVHISYGGRAPQTQECCTRVQHLPRPCPGSSPRVPMGNASLCPLEAGEHHPLSQQKSSGRAGSGQYSGSRRQVHKYPGIPLHTLNWRPLKP